MDMRQWLDAMLNEGGFGLEEENQRVTSKGFLASTPHPFGSDPHMDRDFCESQLEIITGVSHNSHDVVAEILSYRKAAIRLLADLPEAEYLWPFSNPPYLNDESEIHIAKFRGERADKTVYRKYLAQKYGRKLESLCGIHFNYSYPESFIRYLKAEETYPDQIYLNLAEKVLAYSWLIVALTASSPLLDSSYAEPGNLGETVAGPRASLRCSENGYWNSFEPYLDFTDIDSFIDTMNYYVRDGILHSAAELYYPVRLKPAGANSLERLRKGVNHIELRMIDVNPLFEAGIHEMDVEFLVEFLTYLTSLPKLDLSFWQQRQAIRNMKRASHFPLEKVRVYALDGTQKPLAATALAFLDDMDACLGRTEAVDYQREKLLDPKKRYAEQILDRFGADYVKCGLAQTKSWAEAAQLKGLSDLN